MSPHKQWHLPRAGALALVLCISLVWSGVALGAPAMRASSAGLIRLDSPTSSAGPVDTTLWIEVNLSANPPASYILKATTTSPGQNGCSQAQPMPGVPPITVGEAGANTSFHWPSALGRGQYWLCAFPADGNGPVAYSPPQLPPFTVLTDAAPAVTITPPPNGAVAGGTVTATLANWRTSDGNSYQLSLAPKGDASSATGIVVSAQETQSNAATGAYTLQVTLPPTLQPASYTLVAQAECDVNGCAVSEQSAFFSVASAPVTLTPSPTATTPPSSTHPGGANPTGTTGSAAVFPWLALAAAIWAVALALLVATIILILKRRRSRQLARATESRQEPPARPWR